MIKPFRPDLDSIKHLKKIIPVYKPNITFKQFFNYPAEMIITRKLESDLKS